MQLLQDAFRKIISDPAFQQDEQARNLQIIDSLDGPAVKQFIDSLYELSPEIQQKAAAALTSD